MIFRRLPPAAMALLVLALVGAALFAAFLSHRNYENARHPMHEIPWLASQLETEFLRTRHQLALFREGVDNHEAVVLRFDVLWSRLDLMAHGAARTDLGSESWNNVASRLRRALVDLDAVVGDPESLRSEQGLHAQRQFEAVWQDLHTHTQDAVRFFWTRQVVHQKQETTRIVTMLGVVLLLVFAISARMIFIERRQRQLIESEVQARSSAEEAVLDRERLMASVSHELRTPLNAIIGFSEVMKMEQFGKLSDRYREYADDIFRSGNHLLEMVNQILDLSAIRAVGVANKTECLSVDRHLNDAVRTVMPLMTARQQILDTDTGAGLYAMADPRALTQILLNLLSNAIKFSPDGSHIRLSAHSKHDGSIMISVSDNGPGMEEDVRKRVFDAFYRSGNPHVAAAEGAGLGLAITKALSVEMGFDLKIESAPGRGTSVSLLIPADKVSTMKPESDQGSVQRAA